MDEKDKIFFEQLLVKQDQKTEQRIARQDKKIEQILAKQNEEFKTFVGVLMENTDHKIALVAESHQVLHEEIKALGRKTDERFDLVDFKIDTLNDKIDGVATDLKAHRKDTEAHHNVYCVKES